MTVLLERGGHGTRSHGTRRHLRLVTDGEPAPRAATAGVDDRPRPGQVRPTPPRPGRRPIRLTRRGRAAVFGFWLFCSALTGAGMASISQAADPVAEPPVAVVQPGDTLWSVAARHAPGSDPFDTVTRIRELNDLGGVTIHPGQRLQLPPR